MKKLSIMLGLLLVTFCFAQAQTKGDGRSGDSAARECERAVDRHYDNNAGKPQNVGGVRGGGQWREPDRLDCIDPQNRNGNNHLRSYMHRDNHRDNSPTRSSGNVNRGSSGNKGREVGNCPRC